MAEFNDQVTQRYNPDLGDGEWYLFDEPMPSLSKCGNPVVFGVIGTAEDMNGYILCFGQDLLSKS